MEDYTLVVTGEMSYISGKTELLAFKTIRRYRSVRNVGVGVGGRWRERLMMEM